MGLLFTTQRNVNNYLLHYRNTLTYLPYPLNKLSSDCNSAFVDMTTWTGTMRFLC